MQGAADVPGQAGRPLPQRGDERGAQLAKHGGARRGTSLLTASVRAVPAAVNRAR
ncbi:hypothetical protein [Peterkaempfera bronchialis]|uniref:hypothetical protein n=1 Tax=Peterkaempfera bronchialis TaxID=2126346 RepID=UPI0013B42A2A|nr:hypothetical protein [Peterkaempfera bronchialis]